jgi:hypothetical protein
MVYPQIVSIITKSSAERLHLSHGQEVYAVIKASAGYPPYIGEFSPPPRPAGWHSAAEM